MFAGKRIKVLVLKITLQRAKQSLKYHNDFIVQRHNSMTTTIQDQGMLVALFFLSHGSCYTAYKCFRSTVHVLKRHPFSLRYFPHWCLLLFWVQICILKFSTVNCYNTKNSTNMNSLFDGASLKTNSMFMLSLNYLL